MISAIRRFNQEIDEAVAIGVYYDHFTQTLHLDSDIHGLSNLLRHQIVVGVSALDLYLHTVIRLGVIEIYNGIRVPTNKFFNHSLRTEILMRLVTLYKNPVPPTRPEDIPEVILESEFQRQMKILAFQDPEKIKDGLSYIWNEAHKFQVIANLMGLSEDNLKTRLKLISERRNQIVHENDRNLSNYTINPINKPDVENSLDLIKRFGNAVHGCITDASCYINLPTT